MKYTFRKNIKISTDALVSVEASSKEEALKKANEIGIILMDMADSTIGIVGSSDYKSELQCMGDEYQDFTIDEIDD